MNVNDVNPPKTCPNGGGPCQLPCIGDDCILVAVSSKRKGELANAAAA